MSREVLKRFVNTLENRGVFRFNVDSFLSRLRLQKYVFIAEAYGIDLDWGYNMYIRGPYSPPLARDYYQLSEEHTFAELPIPDEFISLIMNKNERWLELAATLIAVKRKNHGISDDEAIEQVLSIKSGTSKVALRRIMRELEESGFKV